MPQPITDQRFSAEGDMDSRLTQRDRADSTLDVTSASFALKSPAGV